MFYFRFLDENLEVDNCITVYPFTAPVHELVMEHYFLHALTDTGLETYTLRVTHKLCRLLENVDDINVVRCNSLMKTKIIMQKCIDFF